jgi:hypothetical protein
VFFTDMSLYKYLFFYTELTNFSLNNCRLLVEESLPLARLALRVCSSLRVVIESESQSYITTYGQSASLSWNKAPIWGLRTDFYYCQTFAGLLMWGTLSDESRVCSLLLLLVLASVYMCCGLSRFHSDRVVDTSSYCSFAVFC